MALPGLVAYGSGDDSDADETVVDGFGSGTVLVSGAAPQSEAASARIVDGGGLLVASGIDAAPGTQPPEAALSTPEPSAHEPPDALPAAGLQPAEGEAAGDDRADSGSNSLSSLPPELQRPPDTPENAELEAKVKLFRSIRLEQGRSLNNQLKAERGYRNPSFLQKMVDHHEIDQYGSGFPQEIFDPNGLHQEDYTDALARADRAEEEARRARAKVTGRLEFTPAVTARGAAVATAASGASLSRPPSAPLAAVRSATGGAGVTAAVNAAKAADSKQRERERNRWDSKAGRR